MLVSNVVPMDQGSNHWLKWRQGGIGSSDAPAIMGVSPWTTPYQLWEQKVGKKIVETSNWATERGHRLEPKARALYELVSDVDMPPELFESDEYPFLRASLDGYNHEKRRVLEIKCPGEADHERAVNGKIPEKYKYQLAHQFIVTRAEEIHYCSFGPKEDLALVRYKPNIAHIQELLEAELYFWNHNVLGNNPPPLTEDDWMTVESKEFQDLFYRLRAAIRDRNKIKEKAIRHLIERALPHNRVKCPGVRVTKTRTGSIQIRFVGGRNKIA